MGLYAIAYEHRSTMEEVSIERLRRKLGVLPSHDPHLRAPVRRSSGHRARGRDHGSHDRHGRHLSGPKRFEKREIQIRKRRKSSFATFSFSDERTIEDNATEGSLLFPPPPIKKKTRTTEKRCFLCHKSSWRRKEGHEVTDILPPVGQVEDRMPPFLFPHRRSSFFSGWCTGFKVERKVRRREGRVRRSWTNLELATPNSRRRDSDGEREVGIVPRHWIDSFWDARPAEDGKPARAKRQPPG